MQAVSGRLVTADELLRMPDEGFKYELVEGRLVALTHAGAQHGGLTMCLGSALYRFVEQHDLGVVLAAETGFQLAHDPDTVRAPDVSFVRKERLPKAGLPAGYWQGPPDLAVEVMSPNDSTPAIERKVREYLRQGVRLVWVVVPRKRAVAVYHADPSDHSGAHADLAPEMLSERDVLDGGDVVPGFRLPLASVFADRTNSRSLIPDP